MVFKTHLWNKEFTPYALNLNIRFISIGLYKGKQSKIQRIKCTFDAWFSWEPSVLVLGRAGHLHYPVFQGDLLAPFRACSCRAAISETTKSGPRQGFAGFSFSSLLSLKLDCSFEIFLVSWVRPVWLWISILGLLFTVTEIRGCCVSDFLWS